MSKKKNNKNAGSFFKLVEIENGRCVNDIKLPFNSIERFSMTKTNLFKTNMDEIYIIKPEASKILDLKLGRK